MIILAASDLTNISIPKALWLSLLGMVIVFVVLVFLMVIIYVMTGIIRRFSGKPVAAAAGAGPAGAPPPEIGRIADAPEPPTPVQDAAQDAARDAASAVSLASASASDLPAPAPAPLREYRAPQKYRVIVNGVEYEVDAETGEGSPDSTAPAPDTPATPEQDIPAPDAPASAPPMDAEVTRKFRVIVNGAEYEVDAQVGQTINESGSGKE